MSREAELEARIAELEEENLCLERIRDALIERVEAGGVVRAHPYAAFEHSVVLAEQVRERTFELNSTLDQLKISNQALSAAKAEAEIAHQVLSDAIESTSDAFALFDEQGLLQLANHRFLELWGVRESEGGAITLSQCVRRGWLNGILMSVSPQNGIYQLCNGRWLQMNKRSTGAGGTVVLLTDITALKMAEAAERESALAEKMRLLQQTVDNLSQGVALVSQTGEVELCNALFVDMVGVDMSELPDANFITLIKHSQLTDVEQVPVEERRSNRVCRAQDGRFIEVRSHQLDDGGLIYTYTDITEHILHAEALQESERWVRMITDQVPALIAYVGADRCVHFANRVYDAWYGWEHNTTLGLRLDVVHGEQRWARLRPYVEQVLAGEQVTFEIKDFNAKGELRYLLYAYVPNIDNHGKVSGFFVMIRDITERKLSAVALEQAYQGMEQRVRERTSELTELNEQLREEIGERKVIESHLLTAKQEAEEANISKTKFLAAVSHDLLQPLNAARLFTGALADRDLAPEIAEMTGQVATALNDVESLISTLVDISRLDAGVLKPDINVFNLKLLLNHMGAEFKRQAQEAELRFSCVASRDIYVRSDSALLSRVLRNLLTNALRYTEAGGRVLLGVRQRGDRVEVQVCDTGCGIADSQIGLMFGEFRRGSSKARDKGLGLGLSIVDKISALLDHPVKVCSQLGRGSIFSVSLPIAEAPPLIAPTVQSSAPVMSLEGMRIWVIDNDPAICEGARQLLRGWQAQVDVFTEDPLLSMPDVQQIPDVILIDYHLDDDQNGLELADRYKTHAGVRSADIIMITANHSAELAQEIRARNLQLLHKPLRPLKLKTTLMHLWKQRS